ncbi:hypothetical protein CBL_10071 [Carabus blaptoides fortunei]
MDWFNVVDCLVQNNDDGAKPEMPTIGQLTYRSGSSVIQPTVPVTQSAKAVKRPRLDDKRTTMALPPAPMVVVDESNVKSFVHDVLNAVQMPKICDKEKETANTKSKADGKPKKPWFLMCFLDVFIAPRKALSLLILGRPSSSKDECSNISSQNEYDSDDLVDQ